MSQAYTDILLDLKNFAHNKVGSLVSPRSVINEAVRTVRTEVDLKGAKRSTSAAYGVHSEVYTYSFPTDCKDDAIIDIKKQTRRNEQEWNKVHPELFDRAKENPEEFISANIFAVNYGRNGKQLLLSGELDDNYVVVNSFDSLADPGTISNAGDATTAVLDTENYVEGSGSIKYSLNSGGTTATISFTLATPLDLSGYADESNFYLRAYLPAITNLTSYTLKFGSDASNYYSVTVSQTSEALAFYLGWNLLKFTWAGATETGAVDNTSIDYFEIVINKDIAMAAIDGFRLDYLVCSKGDLYDTVYYSNYLWKNSSGTYLLDSTADSDTLEVLDEELPMIKEKIRELVARALRESTDKQDAKEAYTSLKNNYILMHPSERKKAIGNYYQKDYFQPY